jgi:tetratricopeptide (TPR) repeat protein
MTDYYTTPEVLRVLKITEQAFQNCLKAALYPVGPRRRPRRFSFQDLVLLRTAKGLCDAGIPVTQIRRVLKSLKDQLPSEQPLANLKVYADGQRVIVAHGEQRWQPDSGQFLLNFDVQELKTPTAALAPGQSRVSSVTAEDWFERGLQLEERSPQEACHAYEKALELNPAIVDAHINLGYLHHQAGRLEKAEAHYRQAIRAAPDDVLGYFNLAVLLEDRGDRTGAIDMYQQVLNREPEYRDAHHNVARLYEAEGRYTDAIRHYSAARKLIKEKESLR